MATLAPWMGCTRTTFMLNLHVKTGPKPRFTHCLKLGNNCELPLGAVRDEQLAEASCVGGHTDRASGGVSRGAVSRHSRGQEVQTCAGVRQQNCTAQRFGSIRVAVRNLISGTAVRESH